MDLMTVELKEKLEKYPIGSQDGLGDKAKIIVKYFNPCGAGTWYVLECEKRGNDYLFFGYVKSPIDPMFDELGYFTLGELQNITLPFGLGIERDLYFGDDKVLGDIK